jgi:hypothetical protein
MRILSCSLGCSGSVNTNDQFACGVTDVYVNQEIRVTFSQPVDINSVTNNSFQVIEVSSGKTPPGTFRVDSADSRVLIYRPSLSFDSTGNPIFGLTEGETYRLFVPGDSLDKLGPYVRSMSATDNSSRLFCTLVASRGIFDATPGAPRASVTVDVADVSSYDANNFPTNIFRNMPAKGAIDVFRNTDVRITFDDVMNPATLANPVTGTSATIEVLIDPDGDVTDPNDQIVVRGDYTITVDQGSNQTVVLFRPLGGFPSSGTDPPGGRKILVNLAPSIKDLGDNPLIQPGSTVFTIESIPFPTVDVTEAFDNNAFEDTIHSSNPWGGGMLRPGPGGGSGRLGDLFVPPGKTAFLKTGAEPFGSVLFQDEEVFNINNVVDVGDPSTFQVVGGVFEFARIVVASGGTLRITGPKPARLLVRGECIIQGKIDVSGGNAPLQNPIKWVGGTAGTAGPAGGAGGSGGARPDGENFTQLDPLNKLKLNNPNDPGPVDVNDPSQYGEVNGKPGGGISFPDTLNETSQVAFGDGGLAWPQPAVLPAPWDLLHFPASVADSVDSFPFEPFSLCQINAPGGVGGGGGHSLSGFTGTTEFLPALKIPPLPTEARGGDSADLALDAVARRLDPELGYLRGGSGGGGGGGHLQGTKVNGSLLNDCTVPVPLGNQLRIIEYIPSSGAGGGSAGGAVQVQSGNRVVINGTIDASGGNGGGAAAGNASQPGGGGAGGAVLLQGPIVQVQAIPSRININGGNGGQGLVGSQGGRGGPGLLRVESFLPFPAADVEASKTLPGIATLKTRYGNQTTIDAILSTGEWTPDTTGAGANSGAQSCWFSDRDLLDPNNPSETLQNFFQLAFEEDQPGANPGDPEILGWDMTLRLKGFANPQSYRGENDLTGPGGMSLEELFTSDFGTAPVIVRFQGAQAGGTLIQPCSVPLTGVSSPITGGTLTQWVKHPADLSTFFPEPAKTSNIFRFTVIWDSRDPNFSMIEGIEEIFVRVTPD